MEGLKSAISAFLKNCQNATFIRMSFQQTDSKLFTNQIFFLSFFFLALKLVDEPGQYDE